MDLSQLYYYEYDKNSNFNIFEEKNEREEREREKAWFMVVEQPKINSSFDLNRHNAPAQKKMPNSSFQNVRGRTQANTPSLCPMLMALRLPTSQWLFWVR